MSYRDTANALVQRAPGNFIGVALYVPMGGVAASWNAVALMSLPALKDWYEEIAGAPTLYYYLAAFDKTQSASPVAETIAPPKPGDPTWGAYWTLQQQGYRWRPNPFGSALQKTRPAVSGSTVGAEQRERYTEPTWYLLALVGAMFGVAYVSTSRAVAKIKRQRGETIASSRK